MHKVKEQKPPVEKVEIMLVTGEASGDEHAAKLVQEVKRLIPGATFFGMGGNKLKAQGFDQVVSAEEVGGVMGFVEVRSKISQLFKAYRTLVKEAEARQPALLILMDFPDFNFLLGKRLRRVVPRTVYFVAPQVWAWRSGRVNTMRRFVDKVAAIFPFEAKFYQERGMDATFVGHPFMTEDFGSIDAKFPQLDTSKKTVAILPGSRKQEIDRLLLPMLDGFVDFRKEHPDFQALIPIAESLSIADSTKICEEARLRGIHVVQGQAKEVLAHSDIGVIASGTATMEAAAVGLPFVSVYKVSPVTHMIAKSLVKGVKNFTMANILAEREVVPELLQKEVTPDSVSNALKRFAEDEVYCAQVKKDLSAVVTGLEQDDADCFEKVADMVYSTLKESGQI